MGDGDGRMESWETVAVCAGGREMRWVRRIASMISNAPMHLFLPVWALALGNLTLKPIVEDWQTLFCSWYQEPCFHRVGLSWKFLQQWKLINHVPFFPDVKLNWIERYPVGTRNLWSLRMSVINKLKLVDLNRKSSSGWKQSNNNYRWYLSSGDLQLN